MAEYILSVVVPCFNEEDTLPNTIPIIVKFLENCVASAEFNVSAFRLFLVDDGSADRTWDIIKELSSQYSVKGLKLSRNYGHQSAMLAGLSLAEGDVILTMDADLQDDILAVHDMLRAYEGGADLALGVRRSRGDDTIFKRTTARSYYRLMKIMGSQVIEEHADFRLMSRRALDSLLAHEETNLFIRGIIPTLGYRTAIVKYDRQSREFGETKYTLRKMLSLALNGITSFSTVPLRMVAVLGVVVLLLSTFTSIWVLIVRVFLYGKAAPGWASTLLPILALGGIQIFCLGIIGEYIGKIYLEVKHRPRFIVQEKTAD